MASSSPPPPPSLPFRGFDAAARAVLERLYERLGFGLWIVTLVEREHHRVRVAHDRRYSVREGAWYPWLDRYCAVLTRPEGPRLVWNLREAALDIELPQSRDAPVLAFIGAPIYRPDGGVAGALAAFDPLPQTAALRREPPLLDLLAQLLGTSLLQAGGSPA